MREEDKLRSRICGCFAATACGDAIGLPWEEAQAVGAEGGMPVLLIDGFPVSRGIPTGEELHDILRQYAEEEHADSEDRHSFFDRRRDSRPATWSQAALHAAGTVVPAALYGMTIALDLAWPRLNKRGRRVALGTTLAATGAANLLELEADLF